MDELIPINVVIGDRSYRIRILGKDEEVVRHVVKTINDKVVEFKTQFSGKDMQDYISMVLIWLATEKSTAISSDLEKNDIIEKLDNLEKMIDARLEE